MLHIPRVVCIQLFHLCTSTFMTMILTLRQNAGAFQLYVVASLTPAVSVAGKLIAHNK